MLCVRRVVAFCVGVIHFNVALSGHFFEWVDMYVEAYKMLFDLVDMPDIWHSISISNLMS